LIFLSYRCEAAGAGSRSASRSKKKRDFAPLSASSGRDLDGVPDVTATGPCPRRRPPSPSAAPQHERRADRDWVPQRVGGLERGLLGNRPSSLPKKVKLKKKMKLKKKALLLFIFCFLLFQLSPPKNVLIVSLSLSLRAE